MRACSSPCSATRRSAGARWTACGRRTATCSAALNEELRIKHTPSLDFIYDDSVDRSLRIQTLLERERRDAS